MRVLMVVHESDAGPGIFDEAVRSAAAQVETWEPATGSPPPAAAGDYDAIMSFGGSMHPSQDSEHPWLTAEKAFLRSALQTGVPLLGVCLGAQLLAEAAGTRTRPAAQPEIGWYEIRATGAAKTDALFSQLPFKSESFRQSGGRFEALEWHSYEVPLPPGAVSLATSDTCLQAYRIGSSAWGVQSHPEVTAEDFARWIKDGPSDPSWAQLGIDAEDLEDETEGKLPAWHRFGRALIERFLQVAAERVAAQPNDPR